MAHIISISNQKGGVGKTTTAISLASSLAAAEKKTLLVDLDPQGNATTGLGYNKRELESSIYHLLIGHVQAEDVILKTDLTHLSLIPSNSDLAGAEVELVSMLSRETRLQKALNTINAGYDYIIIDCPPSLGLLTLNAMTASNSILIPVQCEYYAMEGMADLYQTVQLVRSHLNPNLRIRGIVLTMFDKRNNLSKQVVNEVQSYFKEEVFEVIIPRNVKLSEAPSYGKPILLYDATSKGAECYLSLAAEVIALDEAEKKAQQAKVVNSEDIEKKEEKIETEFASVPS